MFCYFYETKLGIMVELNLVATYLKPVCICVNTLLHFVCVCVCLREQCLNYDPFSWFSAYKDDSSIPWS